MVNGQRTWLSPVRWFLVAALLLASTGIVASEILDISDTVLDIAIHDTYLVVAHWHLVLITGVFCPICAMCYWTFPHLFRRPLNSTLGLLHAALSFVGILGVFFPMHLIGSMATPGRYHEYSEFEPTDGDIGTVNLNAVVTAFALIFLAGQTFFLINLVRTLLRKDPS